MKRIRFIALLLAMVLALGGVAMGAMKTEFSGYMRTRAYTLQNWTGEDETETNDQSVVDSRTRLFITTHLGEHLRFTNGFEMDAVWGGQDSFGRIGTDGVNVEIKHSYVDFDLGPTNFKVGVQEFYIARGFMMWEDGAGAIVTFNVNDNLSIPLTWVKAVEAGNFGEDEFDDTDYLMLSPTYSRGGFSIKPYVLYAFSEEAHTFADQGGWSTGWYDAMANYGELNMYYAGLDMDMEFSKGALWFTGIYQGGEADLTPDARVGKSFDSVDFNGWLGAIGGSLSLGPAQLYGQFFYSSGDDDPDDDEREAFIPTEGAYYYWSEMMGLGYNDDYVINNVGWNPSNIMAGGIGASFSPASRLSVDMSVWYAEAVEDFIGSRTGNRIEATDYGTEANLVLNYGLMDNLNLTIIGAYLFAGDAVTENDPNEADPYTFFSQLKVSF